MSPKRDDLARDDLARDDGERDDVSAQHREPLSPAFLERVRVHEPSERVAARAAASGLDLAALRHQDPLTYAALNAEPLVRTESALALPVSGVVAQIAPHAQLFSVPLKLVQTDLELRVFPLLHPSVLSHLDDALSAFAAEQSTLFFRVVGDASGERRELAAPLAPHVWVHLTETGEAQQALVGPFADEADARAWGDAHVDPRTRLVFDTLPFEGTWLCDVFSGAL